MEGSSESVKAEAINILVRDQTGGEVQFKMKQNTKFGKVMEAYCNKKAISQNDVRFLYDGQRITPEQSPAMLGMDDQEIIDAMIEQLGGRRP